MPTESPIDRRFTAAGWAAILSAVLTVPVIVVTVVAMFLPENVPLQSLETLLFLAASALAIYVLIALRQLLHSRDFHAADFWLTLQIGGYVALAALEIVDASLTEAEVVSGVALVFSLMLGLVSAVFALKILPAASVVAGPLKPCAYFTIATGICVATIILIPIGLLTSMVADLLLASIFFRASGTPMTAGIAVS